MTSPPIGVDRRIARPSTVTNDRSNRTRSVFRTGIPGVTMHRPNEPGYGRDDVWLIDDWR